MNSTILLMNTNLSVVSKSNGYLLGIFIALLILAYLVYSLIKPEKF
jgi:K+-transporting ATPase KdpF subunit